jgi:hypothetical protein
MLKSKEFIPLYKQFKDYKIKINCGKVSFGPKTRYRPGLYFSTRSIRQWPCLIGLSGLAILVDVVR